VQVRERVEGHEGEVRVEEELSNKHNKRSQLSDQPSEQSRAQQISEPAHSVLFTSKCLRRKYSSEVRKIATAARKLSEPYRFLVTLKLNEMTLPLPSFCTTQMMLPKKKTRPGKEPLTFHFSQKSSM
jgi:hypothetical protein